MPSSIILPGERRQQKLMIKTHLGKVVIELQSPSQHIVMEPQEAAVVARALAEAAQDLALKAGLIKKKELD